jgi:hypothetical protein
VTSADSRLMVFLHFRCGPGVVWAYGLMGWVRA